ncbi:MULTISPECIES: YdeI/OmpD-associated family protein [unclassified Crossiella]|uniref:YdeI/OmpD-associated family protein n=1 Tax=unclassified Crossiella TaxID=2620835 RepID=UPI001FFEAC84|nr:MULTISPECIES: YdeI/OmpD-associated family protein [unclassified Crossiella]MCK2238279.1 YdeI/OmpD-associated family protein [Crossiella sp. S99.2]MCK2256319.1 YdeI/OmpD-associated family protein [Crossiella sp. S99.1]
MKFLTTVELGGKTATGLRVPVEVVEVLDAGKRPAVLVTIGGHRYRSTVAVMGGEYWLPLSAENRTAAGVAAGDRIEVTVALDTAPRTVEVPADLAAALAAEPAAAEFFRGLSYSNQRWHTLNIDGAKTAETRARRIAKSVELLKEGKAR